MAAKELPYLEDYLTSLTKDKITKIASTLALKLPKGTKGAQITALLNNLTVEKEDILLAAANPDDIKKYLMKNNVAYNNSLGPIVQINKYWEVKEKEYCSKSPSSLRTRDFKPNNNYDSIPLDEDNENGYESYDSEEDNEEETGSSTSQVSQVVEVDSDEDTPYPTQPIIQQHQQLVLVDKNLQPVNNNRTQNNIVSAEYANQSNYNSNFSAPLTYGGDTRIKTTHSIEVNKVSETKVAEDFVNLFYALVNGPNPATVINQQGIFFPEGILNLYIQDSRPSKYQGSEKIAIVFQDFRSASGQFNPNKLEVEKNDFGFVIVLVYGNVTLQSKGVGPFKQKFVLCQYQGRWCAQFSELLMYDTANSIPFSNVAVQNAPSRLPISEN